MQAWQATVQDDRGNAVPNPVVTVYLADGMTEADIFNQAGISLPNPLTGDIDGFVKFFASAGKYKVDAGGGTVWDVDLGGVYPNKATLAESDALGGISQGAVEAINGVQYYKMPASHPQFGSNPIPDLPGWITLTSVSGDPVRAQWRISDVFGGAWRALETLETNDTTTYSGSRTSQAISRVVTGSGTNGPSTADSALHVMVKKSDLYGTSPGEIDALRVNVFQDGHSDAGGILVGAYKKIGDGTSSEGGLTPIEVSMRRFTTDSAVAVSKHQSIIGFSPNPESAWNGRDPIGFYSENHLGSGFSNFLGIADGETAGDASIQYLIAGYGRRDQNTRYFSVTPAAKVDLISRDNGASVGPTIDRIRASSSPANNDLLGEDLYKGRNSAAEDVTYARAYAAIKDVVDGTEDGIYRLMTMVNGVLTQQISLEDGVTIGTGPTQGVGTLNLASALFVAAQTVIDASRGVRFRTYTPTALASAANAVNTTDKAQGKGVWDMTNNRALYASGPAATDAWVLATGTVAINPA